MCFPSNCVFHYFAWLKILSGRQNPFRVLFRHPLWTQHSWIGIKARAWKPSKWLAVWKLNSLTVLYVQARGPCLGGRSLSDLDWERGFSFSLSFFFFFPIWERGSLLICPGLRWLKVVCAFVETLPARDSSLGCVVCWTMSSGLDTSLRRLCVVLSSHKHMA